MDTIIAFYDSFLLGDADCGVIFTSEGLYNRDFGGATYIPYSALEGMRLKGGALHISWGQEETIIHDIYFDTRVLQELLQSLGQLNKKYGSLLLKEAGNQRGY